MNILVHTDGGARGNPGPAAVGVVIEEVQSSDQKSLNAKDGNRAGKAGLRTIASFGKAIGDTTNNVAEYQAVVEALKEIYRQEERGAIHRESLHIHFFLDSLLVVSQLNGVYKVKQPHLRELLLQVRMLEKEVGGNITYAAVRREENALADFFVNDALDKDMLGK